MAEVENKWRRGLDFFPNLDISPLFYHCPHSIISPPPLHSSPMAVAPYLFTIHFALTFSTACSFAMTWRSTWDDILSGGSPRWKVDDPKAKQQALTHILEHTDAPSFSEYDDISSTPLRILCPLSGDDTFVYYAWSKGCDVTAIDLVPKALEQMRNQFGDSSDWTMSSAGKDNLVWKHRSGRVTLYEGDMMMKRPELNQSFDAVYDKDSFGALTLDLREGFCARLSEYLKDNGTVYIEVKNKSAGREQGPPFHVEKDDLMEKSNFGRCFEHIKSLGEVYELSMPTATQTGHILRRLVRK